MKARVSLCLLFGICQWCHADVFINGPTPPPFGDPSEIGTQLPFLIKETVPEGSSPAPTMRYQQVYDRSLFTNVDARFIYVSTVAFFIYGTNHGVYSWTIPSMQVNISTTPRSADSLSRVFSENVGTDDTIVLGPRSFTFSPPDWYRQVISFDRPFRYNPESGNLLMDVRIFDGSGPHANPFPWDPIPSLWGYNSPTDEVARVWSTNVTAVSADGSDTIGLLTLIQLSAVPSLRAEFYPSYAGGSLTNIIKISWPSDPTTFVLQATDRLGANARWHDATNQVFGIPGGDSERAIEIPASSAGPAQFFRLVWPGGGP